MIQSTYQDKILRVADVAAIIDRCPRTALRYVKKLHDHAGLVNKGTNRNPHWLESEFWRAYRVYDPKEIQQ